MSKRTTCYFVNGKLVIDSPMLGVHRSDDKMIYDVSQEMPPILSPTFKPEKQPEKKSRIVKPKKTQLKKQIEKRPQAIIQKRDKIDYSHLSTFALEVKLKTAYLALIKTQPGEYSHPVSSNPSQYKSMRIGQASFGGDAQVRYDELLAEYQSRPLEERQAARKAATQAQKKFNRQTNDEIEV